MCRVICKHPGHHKAPMPVRAVAVLVRRLRNFASINLSPSVSEKLNGYSKVRVRIDIYNEAS